MRTAALEGCLNGYIYMQKKGISEKDSAHVRGILRLEVKRAFWDFTRIFGFVKSSGQKYFPEGFDEYSEIFKDHSLPNSGFFNDLDYAAIRLMVDQMPDKERIVFTLFLQGYDFAEISAHLGYHSRSSSRHIFDRMIERILNPKKTEKARCIQCGNEFVKKLPKSTLCSRKCTCAAYYQRKYHGSPAGSTPGASA